MRQILENRFFTSFLVAAGVWTAGWFLKPFPNDNAILELIHYEKPVVYYGIRLTYITLWFTVPLIATSTSLSLAYIFMAKRDAHSHRGQLPPYPEPEKRQSLSIVIGEVHHPKKPKPVANPHWLSIPERGLNTGIAIIGAIGAGKTSGCIYPYAEQILAFNHDDPARRIGGLILEVKGDFCLKVRQILPKYGRFAVLALE